MIFLDLTLDFDNKYAYIASACRSLLKSDIISRLASSVFSESLILMAQQTQLQIIIEGYQAL
jgi:hypothetical protein